MRASTNFCSSTVVMVFCTNLKVIFTNTFVIFRYIYSTLCSRTASFRRKISSSAVSFAFVFLWHGMFTFVGVWAVLNFVVLLLENMARSVCLGNRSRIDRYLSTTNQKRGAALLGSQLYILGALSNFVFFTDIEVGEVFFRRTYWTGGWMAYGWVSAMCVCLFHTSEWLGRGGRGSKNSEAVNKKTDDIIL